MWGHLALDILGFVPGIGIVADIANGIWYCADGEYWMAAASFVAAIPMIGDAIGGSAKLGLKGTCLGSKIIFGSKAIAALGGFGLSLGQIYNNSKALAERLNQNGWKWDDESKALAGSIGINAIFALFSAKNAGDNINGFTTSQCFVAGTLVLTIEGNKAIEEIKAGDLVYSTNPETGESEYKEVVQTFENETKELVHISVADDEIVTTPKHPFYVPHKGWTSAIDLRAGDILVLSNGEYVIVEKVQHEILENPVKVYNFEVKDYHTYYVGENSVLVHNDCGEQYFFRGTSEGYEGNESLKRLGVTPTSSDPLVSTVFATNGENYGNGILYIASESDLQGVGMNVPNVFSGYEKEIVFDILPKDFAGRAGISISSGEARGILSSMGYNIPSAISTSEMSAILSNAPSLSAQEIAQFVELALGL